MKKGSAVEIVAGSLVALIGILTVVIQRAAK